MDDDLLGALGFIFLLLLAGAVYLIAKNSWPACGLFVVAVVVFCLVRKSENPWKKAAGSISRASMLGFGLLTLCLLVFNLFISTGDLPGVVSATELLLVRLSRWLPAWTDLSVWQLALALTLLVVIHRLSPALLSLDRFLSVKKVVERGTAGLAVAASFSFFGSDAVLGDLAAQPIAKLSARYVDSQSRERQHLERYLLLRGKTESVRSLSENQRRIVFGAVETLTSIQGLPEKAQMNVAQSIATKFLKESDIAWAAASKATAMPSPPDAVLRDPDTTVAAQRAREQVAADLENEAERAFEEVLTEGISAGTKEGAAIAGTLFNFIFDSPPIPFAEEVGQFLEKVSDEYATTLLDPLVKKCAAVLGSRLRWETPEDRPGERPGTNAVRVVIRGHLEEASALARRASLPRRALPPPEPEAAPTPEAPPDQPFLRLDPDSPTFPTGQLFATRSDGSVILLDPQTGRPRRTTARGASKSQPVVAPPRGISEKAYDDARQSANEARELLLTFRSAAAALGMADLAGGVESALAADEEVLTLYEPTFRAIAERRQEIERKQEERRAEARRVEQQRERERVRVEVRPRVK